MALLFDIEKDIRFKQGEEKKAREGIKNLLSTNLSHQQIADCLVVSLQMVKEIAKSIKK